MVTLALGATPGGPTPAPLSSRNWRAGLGPEPGVDDLACRRRLATVM